jgi:cellulose synthase/poly-beta-1,6-N-acetylglucosamine synthase-like glycosyltransferase
MYKNTVFPSSVAYFYIFQIIKVGVFVLILILFSAAYFGLFILYKNGWSLLPFQQLQLNNTHNTSVSIIIPVRNEAPHIEKCLQHIFAQTYMGSLEIIVINDHSTDNTLAILQSFGNRIRILNLEEAMQANELTIAYKKKAIEKAINMANGQLIITTDGDTYSAPTWVQSIVQLYETKNFKIIAGPVNYVPQENILGIFQDIDFMTMQGITGASLHYHFNSTCNGANLAYSKQAFLEVGGFAGIDNIASGDDMLLLHKIEKKYPQGAAYLKSANAMVYTYAMPTFNSFLQQRIRWASKAKHYSDKRVTGVLAIVWLYNIAILLMCIFMYFGKFNLLFGAIFISVKIFAEYRLVQQLAIFFNKKEIIKWHIILQPLHWLYIATCGLLGNIQQYKWKGRTLK